MNRSHQSNVQLSNNLKELSDVEQVSGSGGGPLRPIQPPMEIEEAFSRYASGLLSISQQEIYNADTGSFVTGIEFRTPGSRAPGTAFTHDGGKINQVVI